MKEHAQYHTTPISAMANTLAAILQVQDVAGSDELDEVVRFAYGADCARVVLFTPSAVGTEVLSHYQQHAARLKDIAPMAVDMVVPHPADPVTSLASMYAGVQVDAKTAARGFDEGTPPMRSLMTECKGKRRMAILMGDKHPARHLWQQTGAEILTGHSDMDVVTKAIECIRKDCYDFILVLVQEFDEMMHAARLYGKRCNAAMDNHLTEFNLLADAASVYMRDNTFIGFCPDHGCHRDALGGGTHHSHRADDLNVTHYFGVVSSLKQF